MVLVDTIYQRVLAVANKEQRGYITPQEFNLLANQAQMAIFDQYFYDINQASRIPGNETEYSDTIKTLNEKISLFKTHEHLTKSGSFFLYPVNMYKLGTVWYSETGIQYGVELQEINYDELIDVNKSPLTSPTQTNPIYIRREEGLKIFPTGGWSNNKIIATYTRKPHKVEWGYVVTNEQALYNASSSTDFELHSSEETMLVMRILELAGIIMNKPGLVQIGQQEQTEITAQQKQ